MKKKILSIITILLMVAMLFSLTACGDKSSKNDSDEEAASPKDVVKEFLGYVEDGKFSKASKLVDWTLAYKVYYDSYGDYDYSEIEEMSKKDIKDFEEDYEYDIEYAQEAFEDYQDEVEDQYSFKIDADIGKAKKEKGTKKIYKVEADVTMTWKDDKKSDEETSDDEIEFYLIKDGDEYRIIGGVYDVRYMLSDLYW